MRGSLPAVDWLDLELSVWFSAGSKSWKEIVNPFLDVLLSVVNFTYSSDPEPWMCPSVPLQHVDLMYMYSVALPVVFT